LRSEAIGRRHAAERQRSEQTALAVCGAAERSLRSEVLKGSEAIKHGNWGLPW